MKKFVKILATLAVVGAIAYYGIKAAAPAQYDVDRAADWETLDNNIVVFTYNGKDVTGKELKEYMEEYGQGVKHTSVYTSAYQYIVQKQFMKEYNYSQEQLDSDYEKHLVKKPDDSKRTFLYYKFGEFVTQDFLKDEKKVKEFEAMLPPEKRDDVMNGINLGWNSVVLEMSIIGYYDYSYDFQKDLVKKADVKGINLEKFTAEESFF